MRGVLETPSPMARPDSRRFNRPPAKPEGEIRPLIHGQVQDSIPNPLSGPPSPDPRPSRPPTGKTTRHVPRTTRRIAAESAAGDEGSPIAQGAEEAKAKSHLALYGGIGGGALLLLVIIGVAASSGNSGRAPAESQRPTRKTAAAPPPPPAPRESPRQYNFVRNTGSIVFVCGGTDKHQDMEVVVSLCPKCPSKNQFAVDQEAGGYRCSNCKAVYEYSAIKCETCGRSPRVTHLKKVASGP